MPTTGSRQIFARRAAIHGLAVLLIAACVSRRDAHEIDLSLTMPCLDWTGDTAPDALTVRVFLAREQDSPGCGGDTTACYALLEASGTCDIPVELPFTLGQVPEALGIQVYDDQGRRGQLIYTFDEAGAYAFTLTTGRNGNWDSEAEVACCLEGDCNVE